MPELLDRPTALKKTKPTLGAGKAGADAAKKIIADEIKKRSNIKPSISTEDVNATDSMENLMLSSVMLASSSIERLGDLLSQVEAKRISKSKPIPQFPDTTLEEKIAQNKWFTDVWGTKPETGKKSTRGSTLINPSRQLQNNAKQASEKTPREKDLERLGMITSRVMAGEELKAVILDVYADVAEILEDQTQQKRSLIVELNHSQRLTNRINKWVESCFDKNIDQSHHMPEEIFSTQAIGTFAINIRKVGKGENNRMKALAWLDKENKAAKPPLYKSRGIDPVKKKKLNPLEFFEDVYGEIARTKSIYAHEFRKLDPALYTNIATTVSGGISSLLPTKSEKVTADILDLVANKAIGARSTAAAYKR